MLGKRKMFGIGMDDYVSKPIIRCNLEEVFYKWLKKKQNIAIIIIRQRTSLTSLLNDKLFFLKFCNKYKM
jgi:hypothetical protein